MAESSASKFCNSYKVFICLFLTQVAYDLGTNGEYVYTSWLSTYSLIMTSCFIVFVYNINIDRFLNDKIKSLIYYLSSNTFGIYMIHYLFITKFLSIGFQGIFTKHRPNILYHLAYYIFYGLFIFIVSLLVILLCEYLLKRILKVEKNLKKLIKKFHPY